jgi:pyruvate/2-oxoglutarate dehydrogenase complex dihydrolipoamide acyltransferase (E2) component
MKKFLVLLIGLIFALSLTGLAFAQAKAEKPAKPAEAAKPAEPAKPAEVAKPAEPAKPAEAKKEAPPKPVMYRMGGLVTMVDVAGKKITIAQNAVKQQRKVTLGVGRAAAKDLGGINVGDVVNVWVTGRTVTSLKRIF